MGEIMNSFIPSKWSFGMDEVENTTLGVINACRAASDPVSRST